MPDDTNIKTTETNELNLILEVFIFVHWWGQCRFRVYINDGVFTYVDSNKDFDQKIQGMSGRDISRSFTTKELKNYWPHHPQRHKTLIKTFEDIVRGIEKPRQYISGMYKREVKVDELISEFYIFPIEKELV